MEILERMDGGEISHRQLTFSEAKDFFILFHRRFQNLLQNSMYVYSVEIYNHACKITVSNEL